MHKILRSLVLSDLFILSGYGLVQPIFAVFLLQKVFDATITSIGIALALELFTRAFFQPLIASWTDEEKGNKRELNTLLVGSLLISLVPLGFVFSKTIAVVYALQVIRGFGEALSYPSWRVLFTRYARAEHMGFEWGMYDTITSLGVATSAAIGAYFAEQYSFVALFIAVSVLSFIGTGFIIHIFSREFAKAKKL